MTAAHEAHGAHPTEKTYLMTFAALIVLTAVSFWTVSSLWPLPRETGPNVVMIVAVCKAVLVAMFFMHLRYDWFKLYFMIVPPILMGAILICALLPDMTFAHSIKYVWLMHGFE